MAKSEKNSMFFLQQISALNKHSTSTLNFKKISFFDLPKSFFVKCSQTLVSITKSQKILQSRINYMEHRG